MLYRLSGRSLPNLRSRHVQNGFRRGSDAGEGEKESGYRRDSTLFGQVEKGAGEERCFVAPARGPCHEKKKSRPCKRSIGSLMSRLRTPAIDRVSSPIKEVFDGAPG